MTAATPPPPEDTLLTPPPTPRQPLLAGRYLYARALIEQRNQSADSPKTHNFDCQIDTLPLGSPFKPSFEAAPPEDLEEFSLDYFNAHKLTEREREKKYLARNFDAINTPPLSLNSCAKRSKPRSDSWGAEPLTPPSKILRPL